MNQAAVVCKDLEKSFRLSKKQQKIEKTPDRVKRAVRGLSFEAYPGEIFGLLGSNGAGKTTTLRMIATLIKPDGGSVEILGKDAVAFPDFARSNLGFLTSELKLEDYFTPNYLYRYFSELHGLDENADRKRMLFEKFGIDKFAEVRVADLSTGMKQKLSLVISLVHDPAVIVFDEPTNGLDVITAKAVTDYLGELKNEGKAIIISTHIFSLAEKLCDRIGIIVDGRMAALSDKQTLVGDRSLEDVFFDIYSMAAPAET